MIKHSREVLEQHSERGICLACGVIQQQREFRLFLGLCGECEEQMVLPVWVLLAGLEKVSPEGEEGGDYE